ncbi:unnamed protein product [Blepharisma stoltei]|uniref:Protein kinase domain-containing protein n=1 Tax=Blepharisma stoltei TaxID=1481888 RepID=A0AAU9KN07_9CILI|nr:unnamed protein product [Blepharisma stoltei]
MSYRKFLTNSSQALQDYEIHKENRQSENYVTFKATLKGDFNQHFYIRRETFEKSGLNLARFDGLVRANQEGIVKASRIFLEEVNSMIMMFIIEPMPGRGKCELLSSLIQKNLLSYSQKQSLFQSIAATVDSLHSLGISHLELSPRSIIIEDQTVLLRPFKINPDAQNDSFWYSPPETLTESSFFAGQFSSDVWAIGCIFAEIFISLTPLFQAPGKKEKLLKMFEILGIPQYQEVEEYMPWEMYRELRTLAKQNIEPLKHLLFGSLTSKERELVTKMLSFNIDKRSTCREIAGFPWGSVEYSSAKDDSAQPIYNCYEEVLKGPYEFCENTRMTSGISSLHSSSINPFTGKYRTSEVYKEKELYAEEKVATQGFNSFASDQDARKTPSMPNHIRIVEDERRTVKANTEPQRPIDSPASLPKQMRVSELKPADNTLTVTVHRAKNMDLYKYDSDNIKLSFEFDVNTCGVPIKAKSSLFQASLMIPVNFTQEFQINSELFKKNYRHDPLVISVNQCIFDLSNRCRETMIGICEVYIGLLFASVLSTADADSSVYGWYHVVSTSGQPLGQLLIEIRTRIPIVQMKSESANFARGNKQEASLEADKSLLQGIEENLSKLNIKLNSKAKEREVQEKSDADFSETVKLLRRLLLEKS